MIFSPTRADLARMFPRPSKPVPRDIWDGYADAICSEEGAALLEAYEITTPLRWAHLLATWGVETGGLTVLFESGRYTAAGIMRVFGAGRHSAAVTEAEARRLAGDGPALFERVYGLGNPRKARALGNDEPGDGWAFRGLGPAQITGRAAHEKYAQKVGCSLDDLCRPIHAMHAALIEWDEKNCNAYADRDDVVSVRKLINGGSLNVPASRLNGLADARTWLAKAKRVWPELQPLKPPASSQTGNDVVAEDDAKAAPPARLTATDLVGKSRKVTLLVRIRQLFAWTGLGGGGAYSFAEISGFGKDTAHALADILRDNASLLLIAGIVIGFALCHVLLNWIVEDHRDGRYVPQEPA